MNCQEKDYTKKFINPILVDSTLYQPYSSELVSTEPYSYNHYRTIKNNISEIKIYNRFNSYAKDSIIYEKDTLYLNYKLIFDTSKKLKNITKNNTSTDFYYNNKGNIIKTITIKEDDEDRKYTIKDIKEFKYDENGNLLSSYNYEINKSGYEFRHYKLYDYKLENNMIVVNEKVLNKFHNYYNEKNTYFYDKNERLIKSIISGEEVLARGRVITSTRKYFYDNMEFPSKITRVNMVATTDNSEDNREYEYDKKGRLTKKTELMKNGLGIIISEEKNSYTYDDAKNEIVYEEFYKSLNDIQYKKYKRSFDTLGNIISEENFPNIRIKEDLKSYTNLTYKFDKENNWIYRRYYNRLEVPEEYKENYNPDDEPTVRILKYNKFESQNIFLEDFKAQEFLNSILIEKNFKID